MAEHIYKCLSCGIYTLAKKCPKCNKETVMPRPPKFSLDDKYTSLRREIKQKELQEKGLY